MRVIDHQTLDAIVQKPLKEQVFAFTPALSPGEPQRGQQEIPQRRFAGIIFGSRHGQHGRAPSADGPGLAARLIPEIADAHRLAAPWLCHNDMPAPLVPCLA